MPELVPDFLPGQMVYVLMKDKFIHRVMIIKVEIRINLNEPIQFFYQFKNANAPDCASNWALGTEVFPTKTDLIDWLMGNVQNEGAS